MFGSLGQLLISHYIYLFNPMCFCSYLKMFHFLLFLRPYHTYSLASISTNQTHIQYVSDLFFSIKYIVFKPSLSYEGSCVGDNDGDNVKRKVNFKVIYQGCSCHHTIHPTNEYANIIINGKHLVNQHGIVATNSKNTKELMEQKNLLTLQHFVKINSQLKYNG